MVSTVLNFSDIIGILGHTSSPRVHKITNYGLQGQLVSSPPSAQSRLPLQRAEEGMQ